jgi:hypothetical protein
VEWVAQEFARADLFDKRLERRLVKTAEYLAQSPASPINEACGNWASTQEKEDARTRRCLHKVTF